MIASDDGSLQILCGALAEQAAGETEAHGVFTQVLLAALDHDPALLHLPLDLWTWYDAMPGDLLAGIEILRDKRDILGDSGEPPAARHGQLEQAAPPDHQTMRR